MLKRQHHIRAIPGNLFCILVPICLLLLSPPDHLSVALADFTNLEFLASADDEQTPPLQQTQNFQRDELEDMIVLICLDTHVNTIEPGVSKRLAFSWIHPQVITPPPKV